MRHEHREKLPRNAGEWAFAAKHLGAIIDREADAEAVRELAATIASRSTSLVSDHTERLAGVDLRKQETAETPAADLNVGSASRDRWRIR